MKNPEKIQTKEQLRWRQGVEISKACRPPIPNILAFLLALAGGLGIWIAGFPYPFICLAASFVFFFGFNKHVVDRRLSKLEDRHIKELLEWDKQSKMASTPIKLQAEDLE